MTENLGNSSSRSSAMILEDEPSTSRSLHAASTSGAPSEPSNPSTTESVPVRRRRTYLHSDYSHSLLDENVNRPAWITQNLLNSTIARK